MMNNKKNDNQNKTLPEGMDKDTRILAKILERGDTVLYENDLPDTFK